MYEYIQFKMETNRYPDQKHLLFVFGGVWIFPFSVITRVFQWNPIFSVDSQKYGINSKGYNSTQHKAHLKFVHVYKQGRKPDQPFTHER